MIYMEQINDQFWNFAVLNVASSKFSNPFDLNNESSYFNLTIQNPVCTSLFILVKL